MLTAVLLTPASASAQRVYVAFGDSITAGQGDEEQRGGYPARLVDLLAQELFAVEMRNRGQGAENTSQGLTRIDAVLEEGGDVLLLMEGTNDIARGISMETTVFNLGEMARKAEESGFEVVLGTLIPRIPDASVDAENFLNQRLNENIRDLAGTSGRSLADPFEVFGTMPDVFEDFYNPNPEDPVGHPNAAGYDLLAEVFFDVLVGVDSVPPVTGVTLPATGRTSVRPDADVRMDVWDFGEGIDVSATELLVNGEVIPVAPAGNAKRVRFVWNPPQPLEGRIEVGLRSRDTVSPPNTVDRVVTTFTIAGVRLDGDIDENGRVDGVDLVMLARSFGSTRAEGRFLAAADFNDDGVIDGEDLAVLASHFGESA